MLQALPPSDKIGTCVWNLLANTPVLLDPPTTSSKRHLIECVCRIFAAHIGRVSQSVRTPSEDMCVEKRKLSFVVKSEWQLSKQEVQVLGDLVRTIGAQVAAKGAIMEGCWWLWERGNIMPAEMWWPQGEGYADGEHKYMWQQARYT